VPCCRKLCDSRTWISTNTDPRPRWVAQLDRIAEQEGRHYGSVAEAPEGILAYNKRQTLKQALHRHGFNHRRKMGMQNV
jgi:hypothetical protein